MNNLKPNEVESFVDKIHAALSANEMLQERFDVSSTEWRCCQRVNDSLNDLLNDLIGDVPEKALEKIQPKLPELIIYPNGSSGIEIRALVDKNYDCVEFRLNRDVPQPIFYSPWMQFEPAELQHKRLTFAHDIIRRASAYNKLVYMLQFERNLVDGHRDSVDHYMNEVRRLKDMWSAERVKYGLAADFSDYKEN